MTPGESYSAEELPTILETLGYLVQERHPSHLCTISAECVERLAATLAELAGLRQDALRWRAVRDDLAVDDSYINGGWRIVGNEYAPHDGPSPRTMDEAADLLASRSLPGALKEEKDND